MDRTQLFQIISNDKIATDTYKMVLSGDTQFITTPGQFVNIKLDGYYLRRPISVHGWDTGHLAIIYKVVGSGTLYMSKLVTGNRLDILTGLGNGFSPCKEQKVAVIGGGVGVPPLLPLAKSLMAQGKEVTAILGFNSADQAFCLEEFKAACTRLIVTTADGSLGIKGFVTDGLLTCDAKFYYACGPEPMLRAVHKTGLPGQLSFEARMGCGFGGCMGCSCKTLTGYKRICVDGPVMKSEEVCFNV